ncbi:hypothetical protein SETIT_4G218500v2 [Setaria italica]|uniref:Uncharacterized protein n=1 Tax=Setaria italica TaxID=4555 RepID=A0A368QYP3_SETIT|nr:hypothetical protein SETIT_4G218500v2 [Setaria italica]
MDGPPPMAAMGLGSVLLNWLHLLLGRPAQRLPRRLQDGPNSGAKTMLLETHSLVPDLAWLAPVTFASRTCSMLECVVRLRLQMKERGRREKGTRPGRPICLHPSASKNGIRSDG